MTTAPMLSPTGMRGSLRQTGTNLWWILLVTGSLWILFSLLVFQFDATSVTAISILLGVVFECAALVEVAAALNEQGGMRTVRWLLAVAFFVLGIVAFVNPGGTFKALSTVFAFYLLFRGLFEFVRSLGARHQELWWLGLIAGLVQIGLAFWAAGDFEKKATLVLIWLGVTALVQGLMQIVLAFQLKPQD